MQQLYQARDSLEARQLVDRLGEDNIKSVVLGEHLAGGAGELSALNFPTVWVVDNAQLGRAQAILGTFLSQQNEPLEGGREWICATCGAEFALCWNCGRRRSDD